MFNNFINSCPIMLNIKDYILELEYLQPNYCASKIAIFDLDNTIIKYDKMKTTTCTILYENMINKIQNLHKNKFLIVIISNQNILLKNNTIDLFKTRINGLFNLINVPIYFIGSLRYSYFRKPSNGMFLHLLNKLEKTKNDMKSCALVNYHINGIIDIDNTFSLYEIVKKFDKIFYVGDSAGRNTDFSDVDIKFALNSCIDFYLPEEFINNELTVLKPYINTTIIEIQNIKKLTKPSQINWNNIVKSHDIFFLYGLQYTGKTHFVNKYLKNSIYYINCNDEQYIKKIIANKRYCCLYFNHKQWIIKTLSNLSQLSEEHKITENLFSKNSLKFFDKILLVDFVYDCSTFVGIKKLIANQFL